MMERGHLQNLSSRDETEVLEALAYFDSRGFFIEPGESAEEFAQRLSKLLGEIEALGAGRSRFESVYSGAGEVSEGLISKACKLTWSLYRFRADWLCAKVSARRAGFLTAGILYELDGFFPIVFLRDCSRPSAPKILAHEMCHAVKIPYPESAYCEYFPRLVEGGAFRRLFGNIFRTWKVAFGLFGFASFSALFFALGAPCLGALLSLVPLAIIIREFYLRGVLRKAGARLESFGLMPLALLFRMADCEILDLAKSKNPRAWLEKRLETSPRWKMYARSLSLRDGL